MLDKIKTYSPIVALLIGAFLGYQYAANGYEAEIAVMRQQQADAVTSAQLSYKAEYERRESALIASYLSDRDRQLERLRSLESKLRAQPDVATLARERRYCLGLLTEGAGLVEEGRRIIEADRGQKGTVNLQ